MRRVTPLGFTYSGLHFVLAMMGYNKEPLESFASEQPQERSTLVIHPPPLTPLTQAHTQSFPLMFAVKMLK